MHCTTVPSYCTIILYQCTVPHLTPYTPYVPYHRIPYSIPYPTIRTTNPNRTPTFLALQRAPPAYLLNLDNFQNTKLYVEFTKVYFQSAIIFGTLKRNLRNLELSQYLDFPEPGSQKPKNLSEPIESTPRPSKQPWNRKTCRNPLKPGPGSQNWFPRTRKPVTQNKFPEEEPVPGSFPERPQLAQNRNLCCAKTP